MTELYLVEYYAWITNQGAHYDSPEAIVVRQLHDKHYDDEILRPSIFTQEAVLEVWGERASIGSKDRALVPVAGWDA